MTTLDKDMQDLIDFTIDTMIDNDMEERKACGYIPQTRLDKADKDLDNLIKHIRNFKG